ncbi:MAG: trypsin-like peptidase domain-containing protein [Patescibacteria group bacterium]
MKSNSPIIAIAKRVCPSVITVVVSKDLPKVDDFMSFPYGGKEYIVPMPDKGGKKGKTEKTQIGGGSGFIISEDGYVITSNHVVADTTAEYTVILSPQKKYPAKVLSRNPINDIAVLRINGDNLPYIELADSNNIELGEEVVAVGNALGEFSDTLSAGIVSGLSRYITAFGGIDHQMQNLRGLIQTDAAINPGNSGGPLVNMEGQVIGINTAMIMGAQNIGFAIPINYVKKDLDEVKRFGKIVVPFLGVKYVILSKEMARANKLPVEDGALVVREMLGEPPVVKNSAADKAGIKEFDIILECNGEKINLKNSLGHILQKCKIGQETNFKVLRDGKEITLKAKLEEKE